MTMSKRDAGRLGGLKTVRLYGNDYMREIGRRGAIAFWNKYTLLPIGTSDFAIINKETGQPIATMNGYHVPERKD